MLIRLKSDIPLKRTSQIPCPTARTGRNCPATAQVTITVRVIEYWVTVEGQDVPEMFCLVTDLMDYEEHPGPELAALYKWRWDGSETALREAKAPLHSGTGAGARQMLRSGSPGSRPAGARGLGRRGRDDPGRRPVTPPSAAAPARKGTRAGLPVRPRDLSFARALRAVLSRDPHREHLLPGRDQRDREIPERRRPGPAPRPQVQVPVILRARHREGRRHPHRLPRHHHHGQHSSLTSGNTVNLPETEPRRTVDPAVPGTTRWGAACPPEGNYQQ